MRKHRPRTGAARVTPRLVIGQIRRNHFTVISTVGRDGAPHSAGVNYGATPPGPTFALYVMTRRHLLKARNIETDSRVSLVIPVPRPALTFLPPATIQLHGRAELLSWDDPEGTEVFQGFWMGRRILDGYRRARERGETRVCFIKVTPAHRVHSYMVGYRIWELRRNMEIAAGDVNLAREP